MSRLDVLVLVGEVHFVVTRAVIQNELLPYACFSVNSVVGGIIHQIKTCRPASCFDYL